MRFCLISMALGQRPTQTRKRRAARRLAAVRRGGRKGGRERIDGWLLTPPDAQGAVQLLVDAHGGPASYAYVRFDKVAYSRLVFARLGGARLNAIRSQLRRVLGAESGS
jgi:dipeptidyl aminopeptidase/acylaminoacyl peptidase